MDITKELFRKLKSVDVNGDFVVLSDQDLSRWLLIWVSLEKI